MASEKLSALLENKLFCSGVMKFSPQYQTSSCEAFHSVVINFAPKSTAFTYNGMLSRSSWTLIFMPKDSATFVLCLKHWGSKCLLQSTECLVGSHLSPVLLTALVHFFFRLGSFGNRNRLTPSLWVLVQSAATHLHTISNLNHLSKPL